MRCRAWQCPVARLSWTDASPQRYAAKRSNGGATQSVFCNGIHVHPRCAYVETCQRRAKHIQRNPASSKDTQASPQPQPHTHKQLRYGPTCRCRSFQVQLVKIVTKMRVAGFQCPNCFQTSDSSFLNKCKVFCGHFSQLGPEPEVCVCVCECLFLSKKDWPAIPSSRRARDTVLQRKRALVAVQGFGTLVGGGPTRMWSSW
jgi:hypothetical protein